jgi:predicted nucleotidyltransferase
MQGIGGEDFEGSDKKRDDEMKQTSANDILFFLRQHAEMLNKSFGVTRIGIFGSFVKGEQTASSDIDIVVEMEQSRKNIHSFLKLRRFMEKEIERKVDLGFEHCLKPSIKEKIVRQRNSKERYF